MGVFASFLSVLAYTALWGKGERRGRGGGRRKREEDERTRYWRGGIVKDIKR